MYTCLFEELVDTYSRQEVLGALVTHVGSGINFEVSSALETMISLVTKYSQEMVQFSSYINGILDYLEGFSIENLHKVYEVFSHLALWARSTADSFGSSVGNELFMILRKQISNPDLKYKKMGIIGTLKIVSCLGDVSNDASSTLFQKSNSDEALELLETCLECCKQLPSLWILFCDELITILDSKALHPTIMEWIGRYVGDFESMFLSDLESGQLPIKASYCDLEGELWMNLDGSISPVCLNILPLASSSLQSASPLIMLPAKFLLLSVLERLANQGSLGGIDALLGCPLHLPSSKYFSWSGWRLLTGKQKQIACVSIYYAINWIRELLNAFCAQVVKFQCTSQASKVEIIDKLLKRLRNLVFLESLLNNYLKEWPFSLPELNFHADHSGSSISKPPLYLGSVEKRKEHMETHETKSLIKKRKQNKIVNPSENSDVNGNVKQPTILDMFRKAGAVACQDVPNEGPYLSSSNEHTSEAGVSHTNDHTAAIFVEVSAVPKVLEAQKLKFRPLWVDCLNILDFPKDDSCCVDPAAELIIHLYLLRDLHNKLQLYAPASKQFPARCLSAPLGLRRMSVIKFLSELRPLYRNLRKHFNAALLILQEGADISQEHWKVQSASAGNPDIPQSGISRSLVSISVSEEILRCFSKMLKFPEFLMDKSILSELLGTFQPVKIPDNFFSDVSSIPNSGKIDYLYCGAYCFFEEILDIASSFSFVLASEVLFTLESLVNTGQNFFQKSLELNGKNMTDRFIKEILPKLHHRLGASAHKLLFLNGDNDFKSDLKSRGDLVQKILCIYLKYSESTTDLLEELACSILSQATSRQTKDDYQGFPSLSSSTFVVWYRLLHEENLTVLNNLVKEVLRKHKMSAQQEILETVLIKLQKTVNVVVTLVNICRTQDKVTVHAMAVKYCGKFVDCFLKVFDFLQIHFRKHHELIIQLVKELQKATRTVQAICSEAKGLRRTAITRKIPATKRSMERFLFRVKALLHTTSSGCTFWMGNLKHKDLKGQVVSSQAYVDQTENIDDDLEGTCGEDEHGAATEGDQETVQDCEENAVL